MADGAPPRDAGATHLEGCIKRGAWFTPRRRVLPRVGLTNSQTRHSMAHLHSHRAARRGCLALLVACLAARCWGCEDAGNVSVVSSSASGTWLSGEANYTLWASCGAGALGACGTPSAALQHKFVGPTSLAIYFGKPAAVVALWLRCLPCCSSQTIFITPRGLFGRALAPAGTATCISTSSILDTPFVAWVAPSDGAFASSVLLTFQHPGLDLAAHVAAAAFVPSMKTAVQAAAAPQGLREANGQACGVAVPLFPIAAAASGLFLATSAAVDAALAAAAILFWKAKKVEFAAAAAVAVTAAALPPPSPSPPLPTLPPHAPPSFSISPPIILSLRPPPNPYPPKQPSSDRLAAALVAALAGPASYTNRTADRSASHASTMWLSWGVPAAVVLAVCVFVLYRLLRPMRRSGGVYRYASHLYGL